MKITALAFATAASLAVLATTAGAAAFTDPNEIDLAVVRFTGMPLGSPGGPAQGVDRRVRLTACQSPLALGWYGARRDAVLVQCPDAAGWRIFVPILMTQAVGSQPAILRGESVNISIAGDGFTVSQPGEALESGPVGAWIRVKSSTSKTDSVRARVVRPGLVRIDMDGDGGSNLP
jgi:flagella basal body P-ring formation protein FlgA